MRRAHVTPHTGPCNHSAAAGLPPACYVLCTLCCENSHRRIIRNWTGVTMTESLLAREKHLARHTGGSACDPSTAD